MSRALVIINPIAGSGEGNEFYNRIYGTKGLDLVKTTSETNACEMAKRGLERGYREIGACGGDGTVKEVAKALFSAKTDAVMGVIPLGNGNDASKGLGIPQDPYEALEVFLHSGRVMPIDVGMVDKEIFVNNVSFGTDAKIVHEITPIKKIYRKVPFLPADGLYLAAMFVELLKRMDYPQIRLAYPGKREVETDSLPTTILAIANGPRYGGKFRIAPAASFTDGKLDICWVRKMDKRRILDCFRHLIDGTHGQLPEVSLVRAEAESFFVRSESELFCQIDGEPGPKSKEYRISVIPRALNVVLPISVEEPIRISVKDSALQTI